MTLCSYPKVCLKPTSEERPERAEAVWEKGVAASGTQSLGWVASRGLGMWMGAGRYRTRGGAWRKTSCHTGPSLCEA